MILKHQCTTCQQLDKTINPNPDFTSIQNSHIKTCIHNFALRTARHVYVCLQDKFMELALFHLIGLLSDWYCTVYPKKYAHDFVVLCFVVVMQSFIMNSHEVFIHNHQGCFAGTGAIVRLPQCQWSKPDGYGKINQCITTTKHSKAKTVCIFLGIYCTSVRCKHSMHRNKHTHHSEQ